jgi:hypothetical protein
MAKITHVLKGIRTRAARTAVIAACVAALVSGFAPSAADAFAKAVWGQITRNGVNQFPLYNQLGVRIFQMNLDWSQVAPTRPAEPTNPADPAYQWPADVQQALADAAPYHMRVLLQLINAPTWADGGHSGPGWAPRNPADFAAFAEAAAREYPGVHLWMIWGEPTKKGNFMPEAPVQPGQVLDAAQKAAPHLYAQMLDQAYGALKAVSPRNIVIGGCTYTTGQLDPLQWLQNLKLPNGQPPRMDMWAHNPFSYKPPVFAGPVSPFDEVQFSDLHELEHWIQRYMHRKLPLFLSEFEIPTAPDQTFNFWVDPQVAASWVRDVLRSSRRWHEVYALGWIDVYDDPPIETGGLLTASGAPKPDFYAFEHN